MVYPNSPRCFGANLPVCKTPYQTCFTDGGVSNYKNFEKVIAADILQYNGKDGVNSIRH